MDKQWLIEDRCELFTLGNGYLGVSGDLYDSGAYINGFYEKGKITYGEKAYGFAEQWQTMITNPNGKKIDIILDGLEILGKNGKFIESKNILNLKESHALWNFTWLSDSGKTISGSVKTVVPFSYTGTVFYIWDLDLPEDTNSIEINSSLQLEIDEDHDSDDPRISAHFKSSSLNISTNDGKIIIHGTGSNLVSISESNHKIQGISDLKTTKNSIDNGLSYTITGKADKTIQIIKSVTYNSGPLPELKTVEERVTAEINSIKNKDLSEILTEQQSCMDAFWKSSDVIIDGDDEAQLSLRFNLFQLLQSAGRDGKRSIAAKGLSGSGYEGHYFWDAETYVLPFFIYTNPSIARSMLLYRISTIDKAEDRAEVLGHDGILFPWRTIDGEESSAYFPAGTAQYHINADISLGLDKYLTLTGDDSLLEIGGTELLKGTAEFWCSLASRIEGRGLCFNMVTGPDEYTAMVNNNYYTNLVAKQNLLVSVKWLKGRVSEELIQQWERCAEEIYLPKGEDITPQDDSFMDKEPWDFNNTPEDKYPLLLHFHPLNIYRKQVLKQADVIMGHALYSNSVSPGQLKRDFDFYEELTTRDSSLSACAQGIVAHRLGYHSLGWEYFLETVHTDRMDIHGNVSHGLHTASMGGSYLMILLGFLGVEQYNNTVRFIPKLPKELTKIKNTIYIKGHQLDLELTQKDITYRLHTGEIKFYHYSRLIKITAGEEITLSSRPELKLIIDYTSETEDQLYTIIQNNCILPDEVMILVDNQDTLNKISGYGYKTIINNRESVEDEFNRLNYQYKEFTGVRPKTD